MLVYTHAMLVHVQCAIRLWRYDTEPFTKCSFVKIIPARTKAVKTMYDQSKKQGRLTNIWKLCQWSCFVATVLITWWVSEIKCFLKCKEFLQNPIHFVFQEWSKLWCHPRGIPRNVCANLGRIETSLLTKCYNGFLIPTRYHFYIITSLWRHWWTENHAVWQRVKDERA